MKLDKQPEFKTEPKMMFNAITEIDNPYLKAWVDAGAIVSLLGDDFWIVTNDCQIWFKIHDEAMHLECIAVYEDKRRQGIGSGMMKYVTKFSDETGIPVTLCVSKVSASGWIGMPNPVVGIGMVKKNKIPVASLPKWYEKHGFEKTPEYTQKKKEMIYTPKK